MTGQKMINYLFRYAGKSGAVIRTTSMQCPSDEKAIHSARTTMRDDYFALEIFDGERSVYSEVGEKD